MLTLLRLATDWEPWTTWTPCTATCGGGMQQRERICRSARLGGKNCTGDSLQSRTCNTHECPGIHGARRVVPVPFSTERCSLSRTSVAWPLCEERAASCPLVDDLFWQFRRLRSAGHKDPVRLLFSYRLCPD